MLAYKVPDGVLGVGVGDTTYAVKDGVLVLPDGADIGDCGAGFESVAVPAGAKPTPVKAGTKAE